MSQSYSSLFIDLKTVEEIRSNATIVIDTNVLLMGYQKKNVTFESVLTILKQLSDEKRLKIPAHVIKEFAKNRPGKITEMAQQIHNVVSNLPSAKTNQHHLNDVIPALPILEEYHSSIIALEEKYNNCIAELKQARNEYVNGLRNLQQMLGNYIDHDLILKNYKEIIENSYFEPDGLMDEGELEKEWKRRIDNNIPPGYMDKNKQSNKYGDLIVWNHICQINNDVIFVTADVKGDWVHTANDEVMGARRELVEEFYLREQAKGHTFKILSPLQFITLFSGEEVEQEVKDDLNKEVKRVIATGSNDLYNPDHEDVWYRIAKLRDNPIVKESYLNEGFDKIESGLDDLLVFGDNIKQYLFLTEEYERTLKFFVEDPSLEFLRSMDVKSLIETLNELNKRTK
ncbi:PIN-like domain-containing protein [Bacillus cereus]|uniref:PIN-like domain-containing protein n=1 Tax=Bacillus cereus TaxID=1396 RepID=UPI002112BAE4|nr:PIN-like domain-containing protein [Bacillus cereus]